ncbi:SIR2 family protein [Paenarthrobacter sp. NPDC057981]|uniref:SIR2 family protein n=1 Tax=Paenarthrobacter sp. NPDC057981 TaxID=3346297 RepID=UPI0036D7C58D
MSRALDIRISLATSMHAQPGVYALLIGSGTSTGTGMPTGYGVIKSLVRQAAAASEFPLDENDDVEAWWAEHGDEQELGYSNLLEQMAPNQAARSALLGEFFEATEEERREGKRVPGPAHQALAHLVQKGLVKVIVTTNFDRLIEQALAAIGIVPQVVDSEQSVRGMKPLVHSECTVIKIHGDYKSLEQRNTLAELSSYGEGMQQLIDQVFDEYGLIINGWSGEWDKALVQSLKGRRSRRYPLFWTSYNKLGEAGQELVVRHNAVVLENVTADEFFPDLVTRLDSLEKLAAPPITEAMAIARLKKLLPYRENHIELRDLLDEELRPIARALSERSPRIVPSDGSTTVNVPRDFEIECARLLATSQTLMKLVATGVMFDRDKLHTDLWIWAIQQLLRAHTPIAGGFHEHWINLSKYPALLVFRAATMAAVTSHQDDVFLRLCREPKLKHHNVDELLPAFVGLDSYLVLDRSVVVEFPRWKGTRYWYPPSALLEKDLEASMLSVLGDQETYWEAFRRTEYRLGLLTLLEPWDWFEPTPGMYWSRDTSWSRGGELIWERDFRANADREAWGWEPVEDSDDSFSDKINELTERIKKQQIMY